MIWNNLSNLLANEFEALEDKSKFLKEKHARLTYCGEGSRMLTKAKADDNFEALKDRHLHGQKHYAGYSQATLRAILYIREMMEYFDPWDIDFLTDFGPGYGGHVRVWHTLFGTPYYQLVDIPQLHKISKYHLDLHNITVNHKTYDDMIRPHGTSLFHATHSLNECPMSVRNMVEKRLSVYTNIFIVYNSEIDGIDNLSYFKGLSERLGKTHLTWTYSEESTGKWRLVGVKA